MIDAHQVVLRFNTAPTKGYEENVGSKTTFKLLNRKIIDILIEAKEGTDPSSKRRRGAPKRVMNLLWRAESYHQYSQLRKLYPDEFVYLITPEFLLPTMTFYKTLVQSVRQYNVRLGLFDYALDRQNKRLDPPFTVGELEKIEKKQQFLEKIQDLERQKAAHDGKIPRS